MVTLPKSESGNVFMGGWMCDVPDAGIPGGTNPVTWTAEFAAIGGTITELKWQWSAAVYTQGTDDPNALGVLFVEEGGHAGAPMNFAPYVTGGARGGGGSNLTGSRSSTKAVTDIQNPLDWQDGPLPNQPPTGELTLPRKMVIKKMKAPVHYHIDRPSNQPTGGPLVFGFQN